MTTRQAMIAAKEPTETSWQRARGNEREVTVRGLRAGECVLLEYTVERQLQVPIPMDTNGTFPFPKCSEYKLRKQVLPGNGDSNINVYQFGETYVEIICS